MANEWNDEAELGLFIEFLNRDDLSWPEIRSAMIDAGFEDRGHRAYQSKAYRMAEDRGAGAEAIEYDIYKYVRDEGKTLAQLCNKFDMPPAKMRVVLDGMSSTGYNVIESAGAVVIPVADKPKIPYNRTPIHTLRGNKAAFGFYSDPHIMSRYAQITALQEFCDIAYNDFGVRHFFNPGDTFSGIYGYRGHDYDLVPAGRPLSRSLAHLAVDRAVDSAVHNIPQYADAEHYVLGGNHDWWMVSATGKDAVRLLCEKREDMHYCGYDSHSIALTDNTYLKLWHPGGGQTYAKSYPVQKFIANQALNALNNAIQAEENPKVGIIAGGHIHISVWVPSHPVMGGIMGCFEGQTNYLKRKGLYPDIGGVILELTFDDAGRVKHSAYHWIPFYEVEDDWKNHYVPEVEELNFGPDQFDTIFEITKED